MYGDKKYSPINKPLNKARSYRALTKDILKPRVLDFDQCQNIDPWTGLVRNPSNKTEQSSNIMKRVHSTQLLEKNQMERELISVYEKENENLNKQNRFLLKEIEKRKQRQTALYVYIDQLKQEIYSIKENQQRTKKLTTDKKIMEISQSGVETMGSTGIFRSIADNSTQTPFQQIEQLNQQFTKLLQQSSKEENKKNRAQIRQKLAETANQLKCLRKVSKTY